VTGRSQAACLTLRDDALNGLALDALGLLTHHLKHLLKALHLHLGLLHVDGECALEFLGLRRFGQFRQAFQDGVLAK
jgi:hypothetical protein